MRSATAGSWASDHLNMIRGLAAVAVLLFHVRYRFFLDYSDISDPGLLANFFYGFTSFGHDAVMVFFVLSGFFIACSVTKDLRLGRWSWAKYIASRGTRLYLVLLPGLVLTLFWDALGIWLFPENPIYTGATRPWQHDFYCVADRIDAKTFVGNATFLQTITVAPLGSNEPLWSLSYEFWYYALFPCLFLALFVRGSWWKRFACLGVAIALFLGLGKNIETYFPIWLLGAAICLVPQLHRLQGKLSLFLTSMTFLLFVGVLMVSHVGAVRSLLGNLVTWDYVNAISFSIFLYFLLHHRSQDVSARYSEFARFLSGFSYSLYVTHMPILVFLRAFLIPDRPWTPDLLMMFAATALCGLSVLYAFLFSRFTEAKTDRVRDWLVNAARIMSLKLKRA